jgi:hypothetical protein
MIQVFTSWRYGRLRCFTSHAGTWTNYRMVAEGTLDSDYLPASVIKQLDQNDPNSGQDPPRTTESVLHFTFWSNTVF